MSVSPKVLSYSKIRNIFYSNFHSFSKYLPDHSLQSFIRSNQLSKRLCHLSSGRVQRASWNASRISSGLSNLIPRTLSLTVGNKKSRMGLNPDYRGDAIPIEPNFRPGSPVSWLRYVPKRCRGEEAGLWCPSLAGANSKLRRLGEDNGWCTNRHSLCDDPQEELWQLDLPYRKCSNHFLLDAAISAHL